MRLTWLTRTLAVVPLVVLVGLVQPATQARQEATPAVHDVIVPALSEDASVPRSLASGPFAIMPDRVISTENQPLLALLPGKEDAPAGFILENQSERSRQDVAAALGDPDEALQLLDAWGWNGNVFRDFVLAPDSAPGSDGAGYLNISLHRFADAEAAFRALTHFSDGTARNLDLQNRDVPTLGGTTRMLAGSPDGAPLTLLYIQRDQFLYRIGASSADATGDPTGDMLEVARHLMTRYDEATP